MRHALRRPRALLPGGAPAAGPVPHGLGLDSAAVRARMVQRLAAGGITSPAVLQAMGSVERHRFVDTALVNQAYEDTSLPIGLGQTISKPSIVARMTELLLGAEERPCGRPGARAGNRHRMRLPGRGARRLAREVYTIERLRALHEKARDNLRPWRLATVHLILGDGMVGYAKGAPYAAIIAAAGGETIPDAWVQQLAVGGRLVAPWPRRAGGRSSS